MRAIWNCNDLYRIAWYNLIDNDIYLMVYGAGLHDKACAQIWNISKPQTLDATKNARAKKIAVS
jgi:hypothetical protein